ncbi:hypothetical protein [Actinokineospora diospyrosa]|uniref:AAA domain-containing protein n=1 Tax=Actinokineospora diospyrosa TaxID=103728 RepID=A0ABT1ILI6_9PSEU|nr:hypothetical protein [Actinokineospora diospyrosa]MCP2273366.1 hypothetical protein [Actinokineospora diospyrosa]
MSADAVREIEVEGFTSISQATVRLGAVNVFIGANGAGKSNLSRSSNSWERLSRAIWACTSD